MPRRPFALLACLALTAPVFAQPFVNWETPHVHPIDLTPDGTRLLVVNTADNRLEVFDVTTGVPVRTASIPVGLDPCSVRARTNTEAWVVNHISDSISIVDLAALNVKQTLTPGDEPADVVFAQGRAFVSVSQENLIRVYDAASPSLPTLTVAIGAEDPRALATDGTRVFAAIFESGNNTTILSQQQVSTAALNPYPGDANPPPNSGAMFNPPIAGGLPTPPAVSLIVKKTGAQWLDDNNGNWTPAVTWGLVDRDAAIIDANTLAVTYATGLMNADMAIAVRPGGTVTIVGIDATNQVRFEPIVKGRFLRVNMATFPSTTPASTTITDLNPHLTYSSGTAPQATRDESLGDPRAIVWNAAGTRGYVAGMGSGSVIAIDPAGARIARVDVGQGPTGLALDEPRSRLYVLNKFEGSLDVIDTTSNTNLGFVPFFDPTPDAVRAGRPRLYDTRATSGLGHASCASCHIDARTDTLSWDLGDPSGAMKTFNQVCNFGAGGCENWHPMKGPMATQTLVSLPGTGPLHWRADRENLAAFNPAFVGLLGDDVQLTAQEMTELEGFVNSLKTPPQPNRNFDNSLKTTHPNGGNPTNGLERYLNGRIDGGVVTCVQCHTLPTGTNGQLTSANLLQQTQSIKIPQLRNMYEKTGFLKTSQTNTRGFGFIHDGSTDTLFNFLLSPVFQFPPGATGTQQRRDIEAFLQCFPTDTHAAIGVQSTLVSIATAPAAQVALLNNMLTVANSGVVSLVVKGRVAGLQRGYAYTGASMYQSDRQTETISDASLRTLASLGSELTWTVVPTGSQTRIGIDRDSDGYLDRDELDAGSDPADPNSVPPPLCPGDADGSRVVNFADITSTLANWGSTYPGPNGAGDADHNGAVNFADITATLANFGTTCP